MSVVGEAVGTRAWMCLVCGFMYYEQLGMPEDGIPPGTPWEEIPDSWRCPECGVSKGDFVMSPL
ncbi:MAG TPA: rubredoxin [Solirubrobacteraceae bacterium]|jgi:rubredoxin|nr:rubredoxin [Solirubrobacteraceae bacterium]